MTEAQLDREKFAEAGANIIGVIQRELDRTDLPADQRAIYTQLRDHEIDLTARWVQSMRDAEELDAVLFGAKPAVLLHALRQHLSPGQLVQLANILLDDNA